MFGYGGVGGALTSALAARGDDVRVVQRHEPPVLPAGCVFQAADVSAREATVRACLGVDTVACCIGLPYDSALWQRVWPAAMSNLLEGCAASGARLVFADNLYMYGPQTRPLTDDMPLTDYGRKPAVRSAVTRLWRAAHDAGHVRAVAVRAADFYGPDVPHSVISTYGVVRLLAGKPALVPYPPDQPHDVTYVPDFARALLSLIDAPDSAYGQAWHVPNAPTRTLRELLALAAQLIATKPRITVLPKALLPIVGLFQPEIRELGEMRFQWDHPYIVDASRFAAAFWADPTPFEDGLAATIAFYRAA